VFFKVQTSQTEGFRGNAYEHIFANRMEYFENKVEVVSQGNVNYLDLTPLQQARKQ